MPSVQEKGPTTLYDKIYAHHLVDGQTIYIDRYMFASSATKEAN